MNNNLCSKTLWVLLGSALTRFWAARGLALCSFENEREMRNQLFIRILKGIRKQNFDSPVLINFILSFIQLFWHEFLERQQISLKYKHLACFLRLNLNGRGIKKGGGVFI